MKKYYDQIDIVDGFRQMWGFWLFYVVLCVVVLALGGCASMAPASVQNGECRIFRDPGFAVRGKRLKDSQWIGRTQEVGITTCGWKRPRGS